MKVNLIILVALASCKIFASQELPDQTAYNIMHHMLGEYERAGSNLDKATYHYSHIINTANAPKQALKGYVQLLSSKKQYQEIIALVPKLDAAFDHDPIVELAIIDALEHTKEKKQAIDRLLKVVFKYPKHQEIVFRAVQAYAAMQELDNAIHTIDTYLDSPTPMPSAFMFHFLKAQILMQMGRREEALQSVKNSIKAQSHFDKSWLLHAVLEEQSGNIENAIKGFTTYLNLVGHDPAIQNHLMQLMFNQKKVQTTGKTSNFGLPCHQKAVLLHEQKQFKSALEELEKCLHENPIDNNARLLKVQILVSMSEYAQALSCLQSWMVQEPGNEVWFKTTQLLLRHGASYDEIMRSYVFVEKKRPHAILPLMYMADTALRERNNNHALTYLKKITSVSSDPSLKSKAFYQMSSIFFSQRQFKLMKEALEHGIAIDPNFAPLLNLLAYYYASYEHDMVKAQQFITQALSHEPENPHFKDTQAYILYKQHEYEKAANIIDAIVGQMPGDIFIQKHHAKIHAKLYNDIHQIPKR